MQVKIKRLHPDAKIPRYAKPGDAGMDLYAVSMESTPDYIQYDTGLAIEIPEGYVGLLFPRSSNSKKDLLLCNSVGVIDSGYRGSVCARFQRINPHNPFGVELPLKTYQLGDAVAQLMIIPYPQVEFEEVDELSTTERGEGGFGSTGN